MSGDDEGVDLPKTEVLKETTRAILCRIPVKVLSKDSHREVWVPKSAIHDDSEVFDGGENNYGKLVLKTWFAEKEALV